MLVLMIVGGTHDDETSVMLTLTISLICTCFGLLFFWLAMSEMADAGRTLWSAYFRTLAARVVVMEPLATLLSVLVLDVVKIFSAGATVACFCPAALIFEVTDKEEMLGLDDSTRRPVGNDLLKAGLVELLVETIVTLESSAAWGFLLWMRA